MCTLFSIAAFNVRRFNQFIPIQSRKYAIADHIYGASFQVQIFYVILYSIYSCTAAKVLT